METVHNYEQIMAWKPDDLRALIGSRVAVHEAADVYAYWTNPHTYTGEWSPLGSGIVAEVDYRTDSGGYNGSLMFVGGGGTGWISGQPIRITQTPPSGETVVRADARERLARHLYAEGSALEREAAARWDAGEVSRSRMDDYRRAADRALAVITGKEA